MRHFSIAQLDDERRHADRSYLEFLRPEASSMGLYVLHAGEEDRQQPHGEDEVYFIIRGRARFRVGAEDRAVEGGDVLFVAAGEEHRFHSIEQELQTLVFFAPPEGSADV